MSKRIYLLVILLYIVSIPLTLKGQSFGYQGKKLLLSGNFSISPNITNFNASEKQNVNTNFGLSAEYALFKKASLGIKFSNFKTTVIHLDQIYRSYFGTEYEFLPQRFVPLNVNQKELYFRNYYKHNSPIGMYLGFSIGQFTSNIKGDEIKYQPSLYSSNSPVKEVIVAHSEKFSFNYIGIEHGVQRVIYDKVILNLGATLRFSKDLFGANFDIFESNNIELTEGQRVQYLSKRRVAYHAFFRLEFGIGYLIF